MIAVTETATECIHGKDCPLHAENPPFDAKALAAMQEAKDVANGKNNLGRTFAGTLSRI
jgi:hypothetical protein